jgi:hypothetical protein
MRALVLSLFLLNLALFGWLRGMFGVFPSAGREPGRLDQQIAPDRVRVLTDREVQQLRRRANETSATPPAVAPPPVAPAPDFAGACVEIGDFSGDGVLPRLREKLTELRLTDHASEQIVELPGWYLVFVPPAKSRAQAERRAEELRAQGVRDVLVILGNGPLRFAISLGSFRDPDLAHKHQAQLERRGVKDAQVSDNPTSVQVTRVRVRAINATTVAELQVLKKDFPQQKVQPCPPEVAP